MVEQARAAALAEAFAEQLKGDAAPPSVKAVGDVSSEKPSQFAVFDVSFDDGDERYRVKVERQ